MKTGAHELKRPGRTIENAAMWSVNPFVNRIRREGIAWCVLLLAIYWSIYVLVAPATAWDAHVYNLSRLLIARHGGLFGNTGWNDNRQILFPWSFDAIHYPFILLGFGYALPSFLCFIGLLLIIHRLVKEKYGAASAWWCCLCMFALPTLIYQATSTKNDLAVVFGVACWYYAFRLWTVRKQPIYLGLMALALGFTAGAKTSGLPLFLICGAYTIGKIGLNTRPLAQFVAFLLASALIMGSTEIYLNNLRVLSHPLGDPILIAGISNRDGLRGAVANGIRYLFGLVNIGVDASYYSNHFPDWMASRCRDVLQFLHLSNAGYSSFYRCNDGNMAFVKDNMEELTDFGPVGTLAILSALPCCFFISRRGLLWRLATTGFASLGITCLTIGWMPWNNRFLMLPMVLFSLALTLLILRPKEGWAALLLRIVFLLLLLFSAVFIPWRSFNKGPQFLWLSIARRDYVATKERPAMLEIVSDIEAIPRVSGASVLLLNAGEGTWVLPILQIPLWQKKLQVIPTPVLTKETISEASKIDPGRRIVILTLDKPVASGLLENLVTIKRYRGENTSLFGFEPNRSDHPLAK
ncbi:MAG: hypothetical protein ABSE62_11045 [Chthoniobacteraceae bacterium]|jgi:hypothetical protein